uniref:Uncharacterized protein n=1 Tax=Laticauda laticaudata TaxID=8630 RepID=A0A8C5T1S4_LATLA
TSLSRKERQEAEKTLRETDPAAPRFARSEGGGAEGRRGGFCSWPDRRGGGRKKTDRHSSRLDLVSPRKAEAASTGWGLARPNHHKWRPSGCFGRKAARAAAAAGHCRAGFVFPRRRRRRQARAGRERGQHERAVGRAVVGGDPRGRAGEAQRQPLPAVEEEAGGAEQGEPEPLLGRGRRQGPRQGAALRLHPEGGLRGAHRQVRLLHHRHHGPQGDRLSVPGRELLERLHHHGAHRLPEQARHPGLQEPAGGRRAGGGGQSGPAFGSGALSPAPRARPGPRGPAEPRLYIWRTNTLNQDRIPMKENKRCYYT